MHTHARICIHVHAYAHICTHKHAYAHMCAHMHTHAHMCTHMHAYAHMCAHMHTHAHICTYRHIEARVCAHVRHAQYGLETDRPPNVTHSMVWGPTGRQMLRIVHFGCHDEEFFFSAGADRPTDGPTGSRPRRQTLRTVWFGDRQAARRYAQYGLGTDRPPDVTHSMVWGPAGRQTLRTVWFGDRQAARCYV